MSEVAIMEKVLCNLTTQFDNIVVTIEETKELEDFKIEDLQKTLEAHELKHGKEGVKQ